MLNKLALVLLFFLSTHAAANDFSRFKVAQGKGQFSQAKHFTFLKRAIKSQGEFVIYDQHVYWHTLSPVSSEMLLLPSGIYRRLEATKAYETLTKDKQINSLLAKLLSGQINESDWNITASDNERCYNLIPKLKDVAALFTNVNLCALDESQRSIVLTDQQNNKTEIMMVFTSKELTKNDMDVVKLTH